MKDRGHLTTELRNPASMHIDQMSISEAFDLMSAEDSTVAATVAKSKDQICAAIELVVEAFKAGGRLIYVGAGTSGRLGVLDASECPPTFLSHPDMVQGTIAGGWIALRQAVEGAEDYAEYGVKEVDDRNVSEKDVVFGISTGGTTPYVHGALNRAKELGAKTVFLGCVPNEYVPDNADVSIRVLVGPEVVTGSTRLKSGTATKMILNRVTTIAMVRIGKVYENLMVDVDTTKNSKLVDRGERMIMAVTGLERPAAGELLAAAGGRVKTALVMYGRQVDRPKAEQLLAGCDGRLAQILNGD